MDSAKEVERVRKQEEKKWRSVPVDANKLDIKRETARIVRGLAKDRDEMGFKELLICKLGMREGSPRFCEALSEFWNVVREYEKRARGNS